MTDPVLPWSLEDLQDFGALELDHARPSDLANPIHPLFAVGRFNGCSTWAYHLLTPSLRLASLILTSPNALAYFDAIFHSKHRFLPHTSQQVGFDCHVFYRRRELVYEASEKYDSASGLTNGVSAATRINDTVSHMTGYGSTIELSEEYFRYLWPVPPRKSVSQILRIQFHMAVTLCHEVAHAACFSTSKRPYEPFFENERIAEIGWSFENAVFGGMTDVFGDYQDCRAGIFFVKWPTCSSLTGGLPVRRSPKGSSTAYVVDMDYLQMIQTKEFWESGTVQLTIPKKVGHRYWAVDEVDSLWNEENSSEGRCSADFMNTVLGSDLNACIAKDVNCGRCVKMI
ncbi:MAG: hypothetical protein M1827_001536 [Pycnora praestabilis]|nr:MAG: hypothetical protein M1827_001536 [Pycnora praestabilis]